MLSIIFNIATEMLDFPSLATAFVENLSDLSSSLDSDDVFIPSALLTL